MAQTINTNILSLTAQRNLNQSGNALSQSIERLSSGLRINSAKDDAAGLAISERFTAQIRGLNQAQRNANDGISFAQTAEGALSTIGDSLQRVRELAVQSANDTNSAQDRQSLNNEVQQLISEINRVASATEFNGEKILNGASSSLTFQVGANQGQTISVEGVDARGSQLGAETSLGSAFQQGDFSGVSFDINGETVDLSALTDATGEDVVDAINQVAGDSGVTARQSSQTEVSLGDFTQTAGETLTLNGVEVDAGAADAAAFRDAINAVSDQTGVTAGGTAAEIVLTDSNGGDIVVQESADAIVDGGDFTTATTFEAGIELSTDVGDSIDITNATATATIGLDATDDETRIVNSVDVLTRENASDALSTIDFALQQVNGLRAELGAVQSRFENTITNLSTTAENLSAARSRIQDADFAAETAALTRAQILQQAGIAAPAQANAAPQSVLSLLG